MIGRSPNTVRAYAHDLRDLFEFLRLRERCWERLTLEQLGEFVVWLQLPAEGRSGAVSVLPSVSAHVSATTVNRKLAAVSAFYDFHGRHGVQVDGMWQWRRGRRSMLRKPSDDSSADRTDRKPAMKPSSEPGWTSMSATSRTMRRSWQTGVDESRTGTGTGGGGRHPAGDRGDRAGPVEPGPRPQRRNDRHDRSQHCLIGVPAAIRPPEHDPGAQHPVAGTRDAPVGVSRNRGRFDPASADESGDHQPSSTVRPGRPAGGRCRR